MSSQDRQQVRQILANEYDPRACLIASGIFAATALTLALFGFNPLLYGYVAFASLACAGKAAGAAAQRKAGA